MVTLKVMCGVPGAGKSYYAKNFLLDKETEYISRDEIRYCYLNEGEEYFSKENTVFYEFTHSIALQLFSGKNVIADATNLNKKSRAKLINAINEFIPEVKYKIEFYCIEASLEKCIMQNNLRIGRACVPKDIIIAMHNNYSRPQEKEFNSKIFVIKKD